MLRFVDHQELPKWDDRLVILERSLYHRWCFPSRQSFNAAIDERHQVQARGFALSMMSDLVERCSVQDALAVAEVIVLPPVSRPRNAQTSTYEDAALRVVFEYVVIRLQSCWRGVRVRRAVAAHVNVLHFIWVSRHRIDRCDACTNDLIQRFVGSLLAKITDTSDSL